jgi:hypothetical protein
MNQAPKQSLKERTSRLTEFIPQFEVAGYSFGQSVGYEKEGNTFTIGYFKYSDEARLFIHAVYENDMVLTNFDWGEWSQTTEATQLRDNPDLLAAASFDQVLQLLTIVIRQDRFCDGCIADAYESGLLVNILRRMAVLASEMTG